MRYLVPFVVVLWLLLLWLCHCVGGLTYRVEMLEIQMNFLKQSRQEIIEPFSNDVRNMTNVTVLLKEQAEILQAIERRTR